MGCDRARCRRRSGAVPAALGFGSVREPLYDARSCSACHANGMSKRAIGAGLVVRLGSPGGQPDPVYGSQLQTSAIPGVTPEARVKMNWLMQGTLRVPQLAISDRGYGAFAAQTQAALRRAPTLFGVAQLAGIPDSAILAQAAAERRNGLLGHSASVTDGSEERRVGRWGWKATYAELTTQVEDALQRDIGLSTSSRPEPWGECTPAETACRAAARDRARGAVEVPDSFRDLIVAYLNSLPRPRGPNRNTTGFAIFERIGCGACHADLKDARGKAVYAYTDLLLHDMGPRFDDGITEGDAKSSEWRTAPLWNIAADMKAGGLMHDGRARTIAEAVDWHSGEAWRSRLQFDMLPESERAAVEKFLTQE